MKQPYPPELLDTVYHFGHMFFNRTDAYARQTPEGSYIRVRGRVTQRLLILHLKGQITLATYALSLQATSKFAVLDGDDEESRHILCKIHDELPLPSYLEYSRRGGHLWFFFAEPVAGGQAKAFGMEMARRFDLTAEVFPKQGRSDGPGSCIRLPFGIHRKSGDRYPFAGLGNWAAQIEALSHPRTVPTEEVRKCRYLEPLPPRRSRAAGGELPVWEKIKRQIPIQEVLAPYVDLDARGRGRCPFHEDQHPSFSVNFEEGYWHCFSGCGGGSVIDFWMKLKGHPFGEAVNDLAKLLDPT